MSDKLTFLLKQQGPVALFPIFVHCSVAHISHSSNGLLDISCIICGSIMLETCL